MFVRQRIVQTIGAPVLIIEQAAEQDSNRWEEISRMPLDRSIMLEIARVALRNAYHNVEHAATVELCRELVD